MNAAVSTKPYLIRAIYEWCVDCGYTPYLRVKVDSTTRVPPEFVKDGEIVLNVSQAATRNLKIDNDLIQFSARFGGASRELSIPIGAVIGIFARENGEGLLFKAEPLPATAPAQGEQRAPATPLLPGPSSKGGGRTHLKVVK